MKLKLCRKCRIRYTADVEVCDFCNDWVEQLEVDPFHRGLSQQKLVTIFRAPTPNEAQLIKQMLEASGIKCNIVGQVPATIYPFTVDGLAETRVQVLEQDADQAKQLINNVHPDSEQP